MGIYTDLALEARELEKTIDGVDEEEQSDGKVSITRIKVLTQAAADKLGKPIGRYITIEAPELASRDTRVFKEVGELLSNEILALLPKKDVSLSVLIVGLGNIGVTADALGPRVVEKTFVTRHITIHLPNIINKPMRPVAAVATGVLGTTGVETLEMLKGLAQRIKPDLIIAIDALASRRAARISSCLQLTDTGIHPGSGVGNMREGVNEQSLGVPVIAIGVPTVVYAATIMQDTLELANGGAHVDELLQKAQSVINDNFGPMIVTPKEIDVIIKDMSGIIADGINLALHGSYYSEIEELLY